MSRDLLAGIDLGTSATRSALYDAEGGLVACSSVEVPIRTLGPGVVEQDLDDFYRSAACAVTRSIRESDAEPERIRAVAFCSQMAGIGTIGEDFAPLARFDSWLDTRCAEQIARIDRDFGARLTRLTGCAPTCDHAPKMLWWKEREPEIYGRIAKFVVPTCYVAGRLGGLSAGEAFIDHTFLHFTGLGDAEAGRWSDELVALAGIDARKLPRIVEPWSVVGEARGRGASEFGLKPGTLIAAGCGDTAACALGAGIVRPGMLFDTAGTASVLAGSTGRFVADERHRTLLTMRSVVPSVWLPLAYVAGGGLALRWARDTFFAGPGDYERMVEAALSVPPGAEGLFFSPHLGGRSCPSAPQMRGAWTGFSWRHTLAHFARSLLESVAFEYASYLRVLEELSPESRFEEVRVSGGGAKSGGWNQIKADVLGLPYRALRGGELGTWGAALVAGKAAGLFPDLAEEAFARAGVSEEAASPTPGSREIYGPLLDRYLGLQNSLAGAFRDLATEGEERH